MVFTEIFLKKRGYCYYNLYFEIVLYMGMLLSSYDKEVC